MRSRIGPEGTDREPLAAALNDLAAILLDTGRAAEAVPPAWEAVTLWRDLVRHDPFRYRPELAGSLHNTANALWANGDHELALTAAEDAVEIFERLAAFDPGAFQGKLAAEVSDLGLRLSLLERFAEALPLAERGVRIYRTAVAAGHADDAFLARSLDGLATALAGTGRLDSAIAAHHEAITIWRRLDSAGRSHVELAQALHNLGFKLALDNRFPEALTAAEEAAAIYRRVLATSGRIALIPGVATDRQHTNATDRLHDEITMVWHNLAVYLDTVGRPADARAVRDELTQLTVR